MSEDQLRNKLNHKPVLVQVCSLIRKIVFHVVIGLFFPGFFSLIQPHCGSLAPSAGQWQNQSLQGPDRKAAGLHEHDGAAAGGWPAYSPRPWSGQGPWAEHGHGGNMLAGPWCATQADRAAFTTPVQTPAEEAGGAQVTGWTSRCLKHQ